MRTDLQAWDASNEHGFGADYFGLATSFEIEALAADPNNPDGALLGFRGPLVDGKALVVPVTNFQTIVSTTPVANSATFGDPIQLDLEGHTVRSIDCNNNGCLIVAGPFGPINDFRLFTWSGNAADAPELRAANLDAQENLSAFEGIVALPDGHSWVAKGIQTPFNSWSIPVLLIIITMPPKPKTFPTTNGKNAAPSWSFSER